MASRIAPVMASPMACEQVTNRIVDEEAPRVGSWAYSPGPWVTLPSFPSSSLWKSNHMSPMTYAYRSDFRSFSTNLIAMRDDLWTCSGADGKCPRWPSLVCKDEAAPVPTSVLGRTG